MSSCNYCGLSDRNTKLWTVHDIWLKEILGELAIVKICPVCYTEVLSELEEYRKELEEETDDDDDD